MNVFFSTVEDLKDAFFKPMHRPEYKYGLIYVHAALLLVNTRSQQSLSEAIRAVWDDIMYVSHGQVNSHVSNFMQVAEI